MIEVDLQLDRSFAKSMRKLMQPKQFMNAQKNAFRRALQQAYNVGNRVIAKTYHIKVGDVKSLSVCNTYKGYISYGKGNRGRLLTTAHFSVSPSGPVSQAGVPVRKRPKYRVRIRKSTRTRWFMVQSKGNFLWKRTGKGPKDIEPVRTVSIAEMANEEVQRTEIATLQAVFDKRFQHEYTRIMAKAGVR